MKVQLSAISMLRRRCQSLAALDLILSPAWEFRYFSFNTQWCPGQQMGSMRDGCGDEWFCLFHEDGWAGLKGLAHEAWTENGSELSSALQRAVPKALSEFSAEPAFRWDATTFAYYALQECEPWLRLNDATNFAALETGEESLLDILVSGPKAYCHHASEYFEVELAPELVRRVFEHAPIDEALVAQINPELQLESIAEQLFVEIGYPR